MDLGGKLLGGLLERGNAEPCQGVRRPNADIAPETAGRKFSRLNCPVHLWPPNPTKLCHLNYFLKFTGRKRPVLRSHGHNCHPFRQERREDPPELLGKVIGKATR